jgi:hypothetical protein
VRNITPSNYFSDVLIAIRTFFVPVGAGALLSNWFYQAQIKHVCNIDFLFSWFKKRVAFNWKNPMHAQEVTQSITI